MTWRDVVLQSVTDYCNAVGKRTFTLRDFLIQTAGEFEKFAPDNRHRAPKIRQQLQVLRDEGILSFVDGRGTYTLLSFDPLEGEVENETVADIIRNALPDKREYLIETFARDRGWVREARECFGATCLVPACTNSFLKLDGQPYIEVHHIVPLYEGGEDALWNLAVVCAHHHKMAHFADLATRSTLREILRQQADART